MTFADDMSREQDEHNAWLKRQVAKRGGYTGDDCPNCQRVRIMLGSDGKRRCEKCAWCIEDNEYDFEFVDFLH